MSTRKENLFRMRNKKYTDKYYHDLYLETVKLAKFREKMYKQLPEMHGKVRKVNFFNSVEDAEKWGKKLKKAYSIHKVGVNSTVKSLENYSKRLNEFVRFIVQEDGLELEDRLMALEAVWITEEQTMLEFINHFEEVCYDLSGYIDENGLFQYSDEKMKKLDLVKVAVHTIYVALCDMCNYYEVYSLEDF